MEALSCTDIYLISLYLIRTRCFKFSKIQLLSGSQNLQKSLLSSERLREHSNERKGVCGCPPFYFRISFASLLSNVYHILKSLENLGLTVFMALKIMLA